MKKLPSLLLLFFFITAALYAQPLKIAKLKYNGGGDWYANKTALPNLIAFCNAELKTNLHPKEDIVECGSPDIFLYPYVYMTGHGNVLFSATEAENLRQYMMAGGFLHIDDNYGLDPYIQVEIKRIFPDKEFVELPFDHPIFKQKFYFSEGLPKIHEHDGQPPQAFGIFHEGRLLCLYTHESDLGNGWEDASIYNDPPQIRLNALKMGANILSFVFTENL